MNPNRVKNDTVTAPLAALNRRLRNRPTSSIGSAARRSQLMNAASRTAERANPATLRGAAHPYVGASMIVNTSSAMVADDKTRPGMSTGAASGSLEVGTTSATRITAAAATGAMAMKMAAQLERSSSQPPTIGP